MLEINLGGLPFHDHAGRCLSIDILGSQNLDVMDLKCPLWVSDDLLMIYCWLSLVSFYAAPKRQIPWSRVSMKNQTAKKLSFTPCNLLRPLNFGDVFLIELQHPSLKFADAWSTYASLSHAVVFLFAFASLL